MDHLKWGVKKIIPVWGENIKFDEITDDAYFVLDVYSAS
jgi:hypothetical protein